MNGIPTPSDVLRETASLAAVWVLRVAPASAGRLVQRLAVVFSLIPVIMVAQPMCSSADAEFTIGDLHIAITKTLDDQHQKFRTLFIKVTNSSAKEVKFDITWSSILSGHGAQFMEIPPQGVQETQFQVDFHSAGKPLVKFKGQNSARSGRAESGVPTVKPSGLAGGLAGIWRGQCANSPSNGPAPPPYLAEVAIGADLKSFVIRYPAYPEANRSGVGQLSDGIFEVTFDSSNHGSLETTTLQLRASGNTMKVTGRSSATVRGTPISASIQATLTKQNSTIPLAR